MFKSLRTKLRLATLSRSSNIFFGGVALASGCYIIRDDIKSLLTHRAFSMEWPLRVLAESKVFEQPNVISETKQHGLFLTIHLKPSASSHDVLKTIAGLNALVDKICPPDLRDEDDELIAGVGFGPNFLKRVSPNAQARGVENFSYDHRKGGDADLPATHGDIFIHAKCNERGKLFELAQGVANAMPADSIDRLEDVYGWVYRYGRDLSGFIDGTANPAEAEERHEVAVNPRTGGSYAVTQRWVHKHEVIRSTKDATMEQWVGRTRADSVALKPPPASSHVERTEFRKHGSKIKIVRQSMPYGTVSGDSGLFFIAYSKTPESFNTMLDRMTGSNGDGPNDNIFKLTRCVSGSYFYFPGKAELEEIYAANNARPKSKFF